MVTMPDGKANTIVEAIDNFAADYHLPFEGHLAGYGSDGAPVMVGAREGVATQLHRRIPMLLGVHCINHREALAAAHAAKQLPYLRRYKEIITQLWLFFENSAVRMEGLREIQRILNDPVIKLVKGSDTRWLSHANCATALKRTLVSVIVALERESEERGNATARGLSLFMKKYKFIATLYTFCDVLPHLNLMSKVFQKEDVDFGMIKPCLEATQAALDAHLVRLGENMSHLPADLAQDGSLGTLDINPTPVEIHDRFIVQLQEQLTNQFPHSEVLDAFSLFDPSNAPLPGPNLQNLLLDYERQRLQVLTNHYGDIVNAVNTRREWDNFKHNVGQYENLQAVTSFLVDHPEVFANLSRLAAISKVLVVSTASCERDFSTLKRVKTYLRNRLSNKVLNWLLMIDMNGPEIENFQFQAAVNMWQAARDRRIQL